MTGVFSSFQHYINYILFNILNKYITTYLNNIFIYNNIRSKYRQYICEIVTYLIKAGLIINIKKRKFAIIKTKYFSLIILTKNIRINPQKIKAILN